MKTLQLPPWKQKKPKSTSTDHNSPVESQHGNRQALFLQNISLERLIDASWQLQKIDKRRITFRTTHKSWCWVRLPTCRKSSKWWMFKGLKRITVSFLVEIKRTFAGHSLKHRMFWEKVRNVFGYKMNNWLRKRKVKRERNGKCKHQCRPPAQHQQSDMKFNILNKNTTDKNFRVKSISFVHHWQLLKK